MSAVGQVLSSAAPAPFGTRAPDGVAAWRQVFEREQMAALGKFRSVAAPVSLPRSSPASAAAHVQGDANGNAPRLPAGTSRLAPVAIPATGTPPQVMPAAAPSLSRSAPPLPSPAAAASTLQPALDSLPGDQSGHAERSSALPLSTLMEKWPSRKLHSMASAEGLHLWLRDASATPQDPALQCWLGDLQHTLGATGTRLASFTLNGKACLVPSIVS
jgi:hypothetical protein